MPPTSVTTNKLINDYKELKELTENFTNLQSNVLENKPSYLLVFRLMLGLSQNELEKAIGLNSKNISKYELGKIKKMRKKTAERFLRIIRKKLSNTSKSNLINNAIRMQNESSGWFKANNDTSKALEARRKSAIKTLSKSKTQQENVLETLLIKHNIKYKRNYPIRNNIIVDFYIPEIPLIIECKKLTTAKPQGQRRKIMELAYQAYRIRYLYPKYKIIALIETKLPLRKRDIDELVPFDKIFKSTDSLIMWLLQSTEVSMP